MAPKDDGFGRTWITEHAKTILESYVGTPITVRQLYYRLVSAGMPNNIRMYKRVDEAMTEARWKSEVDMEAFIDRERSVAGRTEGDEKDLDHEVEAAKDAIKAWMRAYSLERWSNQPKFVEVWIEKKALQGVFERPCQRMDVALAPCKGYASLTFLHDAATRFIEAQERGKEIVILYFGDHDPSGDDIPRSLQENLARMGATVRVERIALTAQQVDDMGLPHAPIKDTDSRSAAWEGAGAVELDAIEPRSLAEMAESAIKDHFNEDLYAELEEREDEERTEYREQLKAFVNSLAEED
jgi:hypothetical protein